MRDETADGVSPGSVAARGGEERGSPHRLWLALAMALGVVVRMVPAMMHDFPLNDGALFYQMAVELKQAGFALPAISQYNGDNLPYAYAPLGFYLAALLGWTPDGILAAVRWIPVVVTCLMLPAFVLLARALLRDERSVVAAAFAFAVAPRAFTWLIMGGGLTRSLGMLFTILTLWQVHALYTRRDWRHAAPTAVFAALTVLSHLGTAPFLVVSVALFWLVYGRHRHGIVASVVVGIATLLLTAPWWATVASQHGLAPFQAAQTTGGSVLSGAEERWAVRMALVRLSQGITAEPLFPLVYVLGLLGAISELSARRVLLPAWWVLVVLADIRAPGTYAVLPIAMLAGVAIVHGILPMLRRSTAPAGRGMARRISPYASGLWPKMVLGVMLTYATFSSMARTTSIPSDLLYLTGLTTADREAMRWIGSSTPPGSQVLVMTTAPWASDRIAEWFPVLANRRSVATVQGSEWLPDGEFARRVDQSRALVRCAGSDLACIDAWSAMSGRSHSHLYVTKTMTDAGYPGSGCCTRLIEAALADPRYERVYDGPGAAVFARR